MRIKDIRGEKVTYFTLAYIMYLYVCTYRCQYINRVVGILVHYLLETFLFFLISFSTLPCEDFPLFFSIFFFLFSFLCEHKKHKNANKQISYFFPLRCFLGTFFYFCLLICVLCFCLVAFLYFFVFFVRAKSFLKQIIKSLKLS